MPVSPNKTMLPPIWVVSCDNQSRRKPLFLKTASALESPAGSGATIASVTRTSRRVRAGTGRTRGSSRRSSPGRRGTRTRPGGLLGRGARAGRGGPQAGSAGPDPDPAGRDRLGAGVAQLVDEFLDATAVDVAADRDHDTWTTDRIEPGIGPDPLQVGGDLVDRDVAARPVRGQGRELHFERRPLATHLVVAGVEVRAKDRQVLRRQLGQARAQ